MFKSQELLPTNLEVPSSNHSSSALLCPPSAKCGNRCLQTQGKLRRGGKQWQTKLTMSNAKKNQDLTSGYPMLEWSSGLSLLYRAKVLVVCQRILIIMCNFNYYSNQEDRIDLRINSYECRNSNILLQMSFSSIILSSKFTFLYKTALEK